MTPKPLSRSKGQRSTCCWHLNSQYAGTGATWRINPKILSTCRGGGILCRHAHSLLLLGLSERKLSDHRAVKKLCHAYCSSKSAIAYYHVDCWHVQQQICTHVPSSPSGSMSNISYYCLDQHSTWHNPAATTADVQSVGTSREPRLRSRPTIQLQHEHAGRSSAQPKAQPVAPTLPSWAVFCVTAITVAAIGAPIIA